MLRMVIYPDTLEKAVNVVRAPVEHGKVQYSRVPEGSSIWITVNDESSPLHGRHVLITKRHDGLFFVSSKGTASKFAARQTGGKAFDPEHTTPGKKEEYHKREEIRERKFAGTEHSYSTLNPGSHEGGTTAEKQHKEKVAKRKEERKPHIEYRKQAHKNLNDATQRLMETTGLASDTISSSDKKKYLRKIVKDIYTEDIRNELKAKGLNDKAIEAKLQEYDKPISALANMASRKLAGRHNSSKLHQSLSMIKDIAEHFNSESAAGKAKKKAAESKQNKKKLAAATGADTDDVEDDSTSYTTTLGTATTKDLDDINSGNIAHVESRMNKQLDKSKRKSEKKKKSAASKDGDQDSIVDGHDVHIGSGPVHWKDVAKKLSEDENTRTDVVRAFNDFHSAHVTHQMAKKFLKEHPNIPELHTKFGTTPEEFQAGKAKALSSEVSTYLEAATDPYIKDEKDLYTDTLSQVISGDSEAGGNLVYRPSDLNEDGTAKEGAEPQTFLHVQKHIEDGANIALTAIAHATSGKMADAGEMVRKFGAEGGAMVMAMNLRQSLSDEDYAKVVASTKELVKSRVFKAEKDAIAEFDEYKQRITDLDKQYKNGEWSDKAEVAKLQDKAFANMQRVSANAFGQLSAAANFYKALAAMKNKDRVPENLQLTFLAPTREGVLKVMGQKGLRIGQKGADGSQYNIEKLNVGGVRQFRVRVPLSVLAQKGKIRDTTPSTREEYEFADKAQAISSADAAGFADTEKGRRQVVPSVDQYHILGFRDKFTDSHGKEQKFGWRPGQRNGIEFIDHHNGKAMIAAQTGEGKTNMIYGFTAKKMHEYAQKGDSYGMLVGVQKGQVKQMFEEAGRYMDSKELGDNHLYVKQGNTGFQVFAIKEAGSTASGWKSRQATWKKIADLKKKGEGVMVLIAHQELSGDINRNMQGQRIKGKGDKSFIENIGFNGMAVDEPHQLFKASEKNPDELSQTAKNLIKLNPEHRIATTATPGNTAAQLHQIVSWVYRTKGPKGYTTPVGTQKDFVNLFGGATSAGPYKQEIRAALNSKIRQHITGQGGADRGYAIHVKDRSLQRTESQIKAQKAIEGNKDKLRQEFRDEYVQKHLAPALLKKEMAKLKASKSPKHKEKLAEVTKMLSDKKMGSNSEARTHAVSKKLGLIDKFLSNENKNKTIWKDMGRHVSERIQQLHDNNIQAAPADATGAQVIKHNAKIAKLVDDVSASKDKHQHIIYVESKAQSAAVQKALQHKFGKDSVADMTQLERSKETAPGRAERIDAEKKSFQKGEKRFVIIDNASAAGHNLHEGKFVHILGRPDSAAIKRQAIGRGDRPERGAGNDLHVHAYKHSDSPFEYNDWDKVKSGDELIYGVSPKSAPATEKAIRSGPVALVIPTFRFFGDRRPVIAAFEVTKSLVYDHRASGREARTHKYLWRFFKNNRWNYIYPHEGGIDVRHMNVVVDKHPTDKGKVIVRFDHDVHTQHTLDKAANGSQRQVYDKHSTAYEMPASRVNRLHDYYKHVAVTEEAQKHLAHYDEIHNKDDDDARSGYDYGGANFRVPGFHAAVYNYGKKAVVSGPDIARMSEVLQQLGGRYNNEEKGYVFTKNSNSAFRDTDENGRPLPVSLSVFEALEERFKKETGEHPIDALGAGSAADGENDHGGSGAEPNKSGEEEMAGEWGSAAFSELRGQPRPLSERLSGSGLESSELKSSIEKVQRPEPTVKLDKAIEDVLRSPSVSKDAQDGQVADVESILSAYDNGRKGFLVSNEPGSGKSYVLAAAIAQMKPKHVCYVVQPNGFRGVANQTKKVLARFGLKSKDWFNKGDLSGIPEDGTVYMTSYKHIQLNPEYLRGFDLVVFDECQYAKNLVGSSPSRTAVSAFNLAHMSNKVLFASGAPFENTMDMAYLGPIGLWQPDDPKGFRNFAATHGCKATFSSDRMKDKQGQLGDSHMQYYTYEFTGNEHDMLRIHKKMVEGGMACYRESKVDAKLQSEFAKINMPPELGQIYDKTMHCYRMMHTLLSKSPATSRYAGMVGAMRTMAARRILESAKLNHAVALAKKELKEGRQVFVSTGFISPSYRNMADFFDDNLKKLTSGDKQFAERAEKMRQLMHTQVPGLLVNGQPATLMQYMRTFNFDLKSPVEELVRQLGGEGKVARLHGGQKESDQLQAQEDFMSGKKQILVGTSMSAGTGFSLHQDLEKNPKSPPRSQINMTIPWTASGTMQLARRTHRTGSKDTVKQYWLFADTPSERRVASVVAAKLKHAGAGIRGEVDNVSADELLKFEYDMYRLEHEDSVNSLSHEDKLRYGQDEASVERFAHKVTRRPGISERLSAAVAGAPAPGPSIDRKSAPSSVKDNPPVIPAEGAPREDHLQFTIDNARYRIKQLQQLKKETGENNVGPISQSIQTHEKMAKGAAMELSALKKKKAKAA